MLIETIEQNAVDNGPQFAQRAVTDMAEEMIKVAKANEPKIILPG